jgi:hypothetical protein
MLVASWALQLPSAALAAYHWVAGPAPSPLRFDVAYWVPVLAGVAALSALRARPLRPRPDPAWSRVRALAALGLVAIALAALLPSVIVVGLERGGTASVRGAGGLSGLSRPYALFAALYPAALLAFATALRALPLRSAAGAVSVLAAHAALMLGHVLLAFVLPSPQQTVRLVAQPALAVQLLGVAAVLVAGAVLLRSPSSSQPSHCAGAQSSAL